MRMSLMRREVNHRDFPNVYSKHDPEKTFVIWESARGATRMSLTKGIESGYVLYEPDVSYMGSRYHRISLRLSRVSVVFE